MIKMREILFIICILFPATLFSQTAYYVSSSSGSDSNSGTTSSTPWKTLEKVNSKSFSPGDKILFKKGDYWEGTLTVNSSGSSGNPITYDAYGSGANPKIYGSKIITGWQKHSGNIYKATVVSSNINQIFVDNVKQQSARYPNSGYFDITSAGTSSFSSTKLRSDINYSGAVACVRTREWYISTKTVSSSSGQRISLPSSPMYDLNVGEGFFLFNKLEFLDQASEWYFDKNSNQLYLWISTGDDPNNHVVRASTISNTLVLDTKNDVKIQNLEITHANEHGIDINRCQQITIDNCYINSASNRGIEITSTASKNITISNCSIDGASYFGIQAQGASHLFTDNKISNIGLYKNIGVSGTAGQSGAGIHLQFGATGNTIVRYNRITNTGYNGIWFFCSPKTLVEYNVVKNACLTIEDGGGIYCFESSSGEHSDGSIIRNNIVDNVPGNGDGYTAKTRQGDGIYLDDRISNITVENNVIANISHYGLYLHNNQNVTARYNTIFNVSAGYRPTPNFGATGNIIKNNIIVNPSNGYATSLAYVNPSDISIVSIDNNKYVDYHRSKPFKDMGSYTDLTFNEWKSKLAQDQNSTYYNSPLSDGEIEKLFYNDTKQDKVISFGSSIYKDIDGVKYSGNITLKPFTAKVLIKTVETNTSTNQSPSILNQTFSTASPLLASELIGRVVANDPDSGQSLTYSITSGNEAGLFSIESSNGNLSLTTALSLTSDQSYNLTIEVTDNDANNPLSASATITINIKGAVITGDTENPIITSFSLPSTSTALTVPILSLSASDNNNVTEYLIKETPTTPSADDNNWVSQAPTEYSFSQVGSNTLYLWVKDASGNISDPSNSAVEITLPDLSPSSSEYLFEETSGVTVVDSKADNDGTLINENIRTTGYSGKGIQLGGTGYIELGQAFGDNIQNEITLSARIKPSLTSAGYQGIIMHGGPNTDSFGLYIYPELKRIGFKTSGTTNSWTSIDNISKLWDGSWHHLAVTYDGTTKKIYLDNLLLISIDAIGNIESGVGYNLFIGAGRDEAQPSLLYQGLIDEVRINNRALTSYEIVDLVNYVNPDEAEQNSAPVITGQTYALDANLVANASIGQVIASDPDFGQQLTYQITQGNETGLFSIDPTTGEIFTTTSILSSTDQTQSLTIQVTDDDSTNPLSAEAIITINLIGVNLNRSPVINNQYFVLASDIFVNDEIGQVIASDPDPGQALGFQIIQGNQTGLFSIDSTTGLIKLVSEIPATTNDTINLLVEVTDNGQTPLAANAYITLTNLRGSFINQQPIIYSQSFTVTAPLSINSIIGQVVANDPDAEQTLSFSIIQGNESGLFKINSTTGEILANQSISENTEFYGTITVKVIDNHVKAPLSATASINIQIKAGSVSNPNQSPVAQDLILEIDGDIKINDNIGQVVASDPDPDQTLSYSIIQGNTDGLFAVEKNTGEIYAQSSMFTTTDIQRNFVVQVKDNSPMPLSAVSNVTININGVAVNHSPEIADQSFEVRKNNKVGDIIGRVVASDPDSNQSLSYTIVGGNEQAFFGIDSSTGELYLTPSFSANADQSILLTVLVNDNGKVPMSATATVAINIVINGKIVKGEVNNNNPKRIVLYSDKPLQSSSLKTTPLISDFVLSGDKVVTKVIINGHEIYLDIDSEYEPEEEIHVTYEKKSTPIYDISGNEIEPFENLDVENNILDAGTATAIEPDMNILEASFYPNPTTGIVNIEVSNLSGIDSEITLYNMTGKIVDKQLLDAPFGSIHEMIDISHLSKGTYIIRLVCNKQVHTDKIILR